MKFILIRFYLLFSLLYPFPFFISNTLFSCFSLPPFLPPVPHIIGSVHLLFLTFSLPCMPLCLCWFIFLPSGFLSFCLCPCMSQLRNAATTRCLDTMGHTAPSFMGVAHCHGFGNNQVSQAGSVCY